MLLEQIANQPVLILGFGREGRSTYHFLRSRFPDLPLAVADKSRDQTAYDDDRLTFYVGPDYLKSLVDFPIIIKTPGIPPNLPEIRQAKRRGNTITSQTQIFLELCRGKVIGVTGTKGKSTTTSLIQHVLQATGIPAVLLGNIGTPPLDCLELGDEAAYFVFEMSSHQLMDVTRSPHMAVLQNIVPEHLDYYTDFDEYVSAKANIARFQTAEDYFIFNADFPIPTEIAELTTARKLPFSLQDFDPKIKSRLIGDFNKYNILPATIIGDLLALPKDQVYAAIADFSPLEHRLQLVGVYRGISFYDAALSTVPEATISAIEALGDTVCTLICGGYERQQNYRELARKILRSQIEVVILFPTTGQRIWAEIEQANETAKPIRHFFVDNMGDAVKLAGQYTRSNMSCLLAPAAPSFAVFRDYVDEAQQYKQRIVELAKG